MKKWLFLIACLLLSCPAWAGTDWTKDENCVGAWLYKEGIGTTVADATGKGNTGNFKGDGEPAWVGSVTGTNAPSYATNCVNNDGSNDYISYGTGLDNLGPLTYTIWINPDSVAANKYMYISSATLGGGGSAGMYLGFYGTYDVAFRVYNTSSAFYLNGYAVDSITSTGNWYHLAITWTGTSSTSAGTLIIYVNGVDVTTGISSEGGTKRNDSTYYKQVQTTYDGKLTENALFSAQLDSTDINDIMTNGLVQVAGGISPATETQITGTGKFTGNVKIQ